MEEKGEAKLISIDDYNNRSLELLNNNTIEQITIKNAFNIKANNIEINSDLKNTESDNKIWVSISNKVLDKQISLILKDYKTRTTIIDTIITKVIENNINGVIIDFEGIEGEKDIIKRFIIELEPKLREIGVNIGIVLNSNIEKNDYINLVDYIIE